LLRDQNLSGCRDEAALVRRTLPPHPASLHKAALKKLQMLNAAGALGDLALPPGNRLERLKGDREGQHSIRINDQYRICFEWCEGNAYSVEITDYH
jgi:proteic killer suppression protein